MGVFSNRLTRCSCFFLLFTHCDIRYVYFRESFNDKITHSFFPGSLLFWTIQNHFFCLYLASSSFTRVFALLALDAFLYVPLSRCWTLSWMFRRQAKLVDARSFILMCALTLYISSHLMCLYVLHAVCCMQCTTVIVYAMGVVGCLYCMHA